MLADVLPYLRCPICRQPLSATGSAVRCPAGHSFDLARQGYVNLTHGRARHPGDSAAMVAARESLLATGALDFVPDGLAALAGARRGLVVDVGAGTGHHLSRFLRALPDAVGLAVDASKPALRRAARAHPRIGAVAGDVWQSLPVADRAAAAVLVIFAPRNPAEFARIMAPHGVLLVATPTADHLADLAARLDTAAGVRLLRIDPEKPAQLATSLGGYFQVDSEQVQTRLLTLRRAEVENLISMGPSAAHTDPAALRAAVGGLAEPVPVTVSVRLTRFTPLPMWTDRSLPSRAAGRDRAHGR